VVCGGRLLEAWMMLSTNSYIKMMLKAP